jgi:RNA polymerase sigma factor (TIGR02999 family)
MSAFSSNDSDPGDVTGLLLAWRAGDAMAGERLIQVVYEELHQQAERAMRREDAAHTLQPTALVNEAYLRLLNQERIEWQNRAQFFGVAAQVMRRVLVDHARARLAEKRGGGIAAISLRDNNVGGDPGADDRDVDILALHDAIERLSAFDTAQARVVELRYFAGLTIQETAEALEISPATVKREWVIARAWLRRELNR